MSKCGNCTGACSQCTGCGASLTLTEGELCVLRKLAEFAFLPVARTAAEETPIYLGDRERSQEEYSLILQCLEKKNLISIDFALPLKGFAYGEDTHPLYRGSMGLTRRGQQILELLEVQGLEA